MDSGSVAGYEHVLEATHVLKDAVADLFDLPGAARWGSVGREPTGQRGQ